MVQFSENNSVDGDAVTFIESKDLRFTRQFCSVRSQNACFHTAGKGHLFAVLYFHTDAQRTGLIIFLTVEFGRDVMVADECLRCGIDEYIAVDTAHAPHILAFEVRTVREADHADTDIVSAHLHEFGNIKFGIIVGTLRVAGIFAIHPDVCTTVNTIEMEEDFLSIPRRWYFKVAAV